MPYPKPPIIVAGLAILFIILAATSASRKSLTWDESTFITSGYTYLDRSDFRLNPEAPPLLQELAALPIWLGTFEAPDYGHDAWKNPQQVQLARDFVNRNGNRIADLGWWARFPTWILGGCLVMIAAAFCAQVAGPVAAVTCALLIAVSPNLLAHGRLATTDFGCAALMFGSVFAFKVAIDRNRPSIWLLAGMAAGMALLTKYTALLLLPAFALLGLYEWLWRKQPLKDLLVGASLMSASIVFILFVGYDFDWGPARYWEGMGAIYSRTVPDFSFYLMGEILAEPAWYYSGVTFFLKTPEPTIFLILIAGWAVIRSAPLRPAAVYLLTPAALVLFASCFDQANLGLRRILPIYPFLFAFIAIAGSAKPCRTCKWIYNGLIVWVCLASTLAYPHYLSYFNVLSGGSANGPNLLDDSNIDWGQDLPAVAQWQKENPSTPIKLRYFGTVEPELYGVTAQHMPDEDVIAPKPGTYAVSTHNLVYFRKTALKANRPDIDWLSRYEPFLRVAPSIYLYRFPQQKKRRSVIRASPRAYLSCRFLRVRSSPVPQAFRGTLLDRIGRLPSSSSFACCRMPRIAFANAAAAFFAIISCAFFRSRRYSSGVRVGGAFLAAIAVRTSSTRRSTTSPSVSIGQSFTNR
jgi:hypothetical protein